MKTIIIPSLLCAFALASCTGNSTDSTLAEALKNPLFAERYSEEIIAHLTDLQINKVIAPEDTQTLTKVEQVKAEWKKVAAQASDTRSKGKYGRFSLASSEGFVTGGVLVHNNMLYLSSDFEAMPTPTLELYTSTRVDPRADGVFPGEGDAKILTLASPYGMQQYGVADLGDEYRTIVLYDAFLNRIIGFAQL